MAPPIALTIAGSDSSGGAGIQADLKTFSALGVYGASVIVAVTAQNTREVSAIHAVPCETVSAQIDAVFSDLSVAAVKIGMLGSAALVETVAERLDHHKPENIVLDPVMAATSGDALADLEAVDALRAYLLPVADLITPNIPETALLLEKAPITDADEMPDCAQALLDLGARAVLIKGGHLSGANSPDYFSNGKRRELIEGKRIETRNTHGTGCTLSSAIAAHLAQGLPLFDAVVAAKAFLSAALENADRLDVGQGRGPVHHFHDTWKM